MEASAPIVARSDFTRAFFLPKDFFFRDFSRNFFCPEKFRQHRVILPFPAPPDRSPPFSPASQTTAVTGVFPPISSIRVFPILRRGKRQSGHSAGRNPGLLYRYFPNKVLFPDPGKGARKKSAIRAPIANPGLF